MLISAMNKKESSIKAPKAVGLVSGGLDSALAAKVVRDLGVDVTALYFSMPWGCCNKSKAQELALKLGIRFMILQLDERYLEIVKNPKHGYGAALNPCVDCRIHMFSRARQFMDSIGADFVFTGEVLGQRPMSQMRQSMATIERHSGLEGRLLRPLCAQLLEPTIPEQQGKIDRSRLLALSGRSRKEQMALAEELGIDGYLTPAGGCLLTDKNFAHRMKDTLDHGYRTFRETISLKWGRHFRLSKDHKVIIGRNEEENGAIRHYAHADDHIMELDGQSGPTLILKGPAPSDEVLSTAAGLIRRYSKMREVKHVKVAVWPVGKDDQRTLINAADLNEETIQSMKL